MTTAITSTPGDSPRRRPTSPAAAVARAHLPEAVGALVLRVTGRCRLWPSERTDVALELCGHVQDALEAGASPEEVIASFGEADRAAELITRARKRLRPLWWRAGRHSLRTIAAVMLLAVALYGLAAARFFIGGPTISRNFMREMNEPVLAVPVSERAWPRYMDALRAFGPEPEVQFTEPVPTKPGDPTWPEYAAWLKSRATALEIMREAAGRPHLGYVLSADHPPEYVALLESRQPGYKHSPMPEVENPLLIGVLLPHLGEMRRMARWASADAVLAASEGDRARFLANIEAMLGMGEQCLGQDYLITALVGVAIFEFARDTAQRHALDAGLLTDADLTRLAHRFGGFARGRDVFDLRGERSSVEDILQRFFSDDGEGGGYFVASDETERMYDDFGVARPKALPLLKAFQPIQSVAFPNRHEINRMLDEFMVQAAADQALPPWRHHERRADVLYEEIGNSGIYNALPIIRSLRGGTNVEPLANAFASRDLAFAKRDAFLAVLALELCRRRTGAYPSDLSSLVPAYLPSLPTDPMDGRPLRYIAPASPGGMPLLYSVGVDGKDDGGKAPTTKGGRSSVSSLRWFKDFRTPRPLSPEEERAMLEARGDWVMWPALPPLPE